MMEAVFLFLKLNNFMKFFFTAILNLLIVALYAQDTSKYTNAEIIYGRKDGMALTMFKLAPKQQTNGKAIISVVSGNWISNYSMVPRFADRTLTYLNSGYTVFLALHGSQPRYDITDETKDLKRAVRFVRYNAKIYGIDPDHIGITGSSSGGQLALMTALADDKINADAKDPIDRVSSRVQAAAVFFPPTDFLNWGSQGARTSKQNIKKAGVAGAFDFKILSDSTGMYEHIAAENVNMETARMMSPIANVSADDPPVLIVHGDSDRVVPIQQSQTLIQKLKTAGVINEFIIKPGGGHGWRDTQPEEKRFTAWFDKYLK